MIGSAFNSGSETLVATNTLLPAKATNASVGKEKQVVAQEDHGVSLGKTSRIVAGLIARGIHHQRRSRRPSQSLRDHSKATTPTLRLPQALRGDQLRADG
jgi:hypothetical protein